MRKILYVISFDGLKFIDPAWLGDYLPKVKTDFQKMEQFYGEAAAQDYQRFFSKLKHYRAIATRYEKHDANFLALVKLTATRIWLRVYESVS